MRSLKSPKGKPEANERMTIHPSRLRSGAAMAGSDLSRSATVTRASEESGQDQRDHHDQRGDDEQIPGATRQARAIRLPPWSGSGTVGPALLRVRSPRHRHRGRGRPGSPRRRPNPAPAGPRHRTSPPRRSRCPARLAHSPGRSARCRTRPGPAVRRHVRELLPLHHAGEAVGTEDERVSPPEPLTAQVHLDPWIRPQRLENDVPALALLRLLLRQLAGVHQSLGERLVARELKGRPVADQVAPAVTDLGEVQLVPEDPAAVTVVPMPRTSGCSRA